jgi:hypothetical protein
MTGVLKNMIPFFCGFMLLLSGGGCRKDDRSSDIMDFIRLGDHVHSMGLISLDLYKVLFFHTTPEIIDSDGLMVISKDSISPDECIYVCEMSATDSITQKVYYGLDHKVRLGRIKIYMNQLTDSIVLTNDPGTTFEVGYHPGRLYVFDTFFVQSVVYGRLKDQMRTHSTGIWRGLTTNTIEYSFSSEGFSDTGLYSELRGRPWTTRFVLSDKRFHCEMETEHLEFMFDSECAALFQKGGAQILDQKTQWKVEFNVFPHLHRCDRWLRISNGMREFTTELME